MFKSPDASMKLFMLVAHQTYSILRHISFECFGFFHVGFYEFISRLFLKRSWFYSCEAFCEWFDLITKQSGQTNTYELFFCEPENKSQPPIPVRLTYLMNNYGSNRKNIYVVLPMLLYMRDITTGPILYLSIYFMACCYLVCFLPGAGSILQCCQELKPTRNCSIKRHVVLAIKRRHI